MIITNMNMVFGIIGFIISLVLLFVIMVSIEMKIQRKQKQKIVTKELVKELDALSKEERDQYLKELDIELEYQEYKEKNKQ